MKKILFLICVLISQISLSQFKDNEDGTFYFQKTFECSEISSTRIHSLTNEWIAKNFNNPEEVTKYDSEEKTIVRGNFKIGENPQTFHFSMTSEYKDGKYRLTFDELYSSMFFMGENIENNLIKVENYTFEKFKEEMKKSRDILPSKAAKKQYDKILDDDSQMKTMFASASNNYEVSYNGVRNQILSMTDDLYKHITNNNDY